MTDPLSVASFALSLIKTAGEQLNKLRERAQVTKDLEIKEHVGNLYDTMNGIKEAFSRLADENTELKRQLEQQLRPPAKPQIKQVGNTNYYFMGEDDGPYCQPCYDKQGKLVRLLPQVHGMNGVIKRDCPVCHQTFYEQEPLPSPLDDFGRRGGPQGWMR